MKKILSTIGVSGVVYLFPLVALAQFTDIDAFLGNVILFINQTLVPLVFAIAFLVFLWGIFKYFILGGGDEAKRAEGKQLMLWAIIGFLVMVSIWGIINLLSRGIGLRNQQTIEQLIPNAPRNNP